MALMLTSGGVGHRFHGLRGSARGLIRSADGALRKELRVTKTAEVAMSAFAFGLIQGKYKDKGGAVIRNLPVDLLAGTAFHLLGLFGFAKPYAHHLAALGDGALASFFTTTGYRVGERWSKGGSLTSGIAGMFGDASPITGGSAIADKELSSLVRE